MDTGVSRAAASSCAAAASLALLELGRFAAGCTAFAEALATGFATLSGAARAADTVEGFFLDATGAVLSADVFFTEVADLACVTVLVGSSEPLPVAFFPPVVFAIAIRLLPWKTNR
nr:RNA polymerase subunit sigma [Paraburkholderia flava]